MARHRGSAVPRRGGPGRLPVLSVALVAVVAAGWFGWPVLRGAIERTADRAQQCAQGTSTLLVAVAPDVELPLREAAERWNARHTVVDQRCVTVQVEAADSAHVLAELRDGWTDGPAPQAWLPESSLWVNRLEDAVGDARIGSPPESVAISPVVLAAKPQTASAITDSGAVAWSELPALTAAPDGWRRFAMPQWGRFAVAVPAPADNIASSLAVQATLSALGTQNPVTEQALATAPVNKGMVELAAAQPSAVPATTRDALEQLAARDGTDPFGTVPTLEVDLYRRNLALDGRPPANWPLMEIVLTGCTPVADFPLVGLAGDGIDDTALEATRRFRDYLEEPDQQQILSAAGLRAGTSGGRPANAPGMSWPDLPPRMVLADTNTVERISAAWSQTTAGGQTVSLLVNVSRSLSSPGGNGRSRLSWLVQALHHYVDDTETGSIALWAYGHDLDAGASYRRLVPLGPVAVQRTALDAAIDGLSAQGGSNLYDSLGAVYSAAVDGYQPGRRDRVVVVTDSRDDSAGTLAQLRSRLHGLADQGRPVRVDVIVIGADPDRAQLRELTKATGGTLLPTADARGVQSALDQLLSR